MATALRVTMYLMSLEKFCVLAFGHVCGRARGKRSSSKSPLRHKVCICHASNLGICKPDDEMGGVSGRSSSGSPSAQYHSPKRPSLRPSVSASASDRAAFAVSEIRPPVPAEQLRPPSLGVGLHFFVSLRINVVNFSITG